MTAILVDSNILIDIVTESPSWADRSYEAVVRASRTRELVINAIIFAEVSMPFQRIEDIDERLTSVFRREEVPWEAAFLAGKVFLSYRRRGGQRTSPLPVFFIGAHAAVRGYELLTRDPKGFRSYFPTVGILTPEHLDS